MNDDAALLHRYADDRSEDAFAELVRRHLGLVYHAALRQTGGDPHRAQEVAQLVFTEVARQAAKLATHPHLVAWLHTCTRQIASQLRRTEARRLAREQVAFQMNADERAAAPEPAADWERLRPLIDDALQSLAERDRAAVLLRFFENRSYAELAASLAVSEDAARVRVNRALEKLRAALARRGLASTASALALALATPALAATPPGLAASITTASLSAAAVTAGTGGAAGLAGGTLSTTTTGATALGTAKIALSTAGALALLSLGITLHQHRAASFQNSKFPIPNSSSPALSAAELRAILHPPRLSTAEADDALAAYLALPPLSEDTSPAEYLERASRLRALLTRLPAEHHGRLLAATAARPGEPEARLRHIAFTAWTELEAPAAARWIAALETDAAIDATQHATLTTEAALAWSRGDFDAAYAWSSTLPDGVLSRAVAIELLTWLAATDHQRALALARTGDDTFFTSARVAIFKVWAKKAPAAALQALGPAIQENDQERWVLLPALKVWAGDDAPAALDWLLREAPAAASRTDQPLLTSLIYWAPAGSSDPGAFADLLASRADLNATSQHLSNYLREWAGLDSAAALAWLDRLPDPARRLGLIRSALPWHGWPAPAPEAYLPLALRLPAGPEREAQLTNLLSSWAKESPAAATAWLAAHDTPEFAAIGDRVQGTLLAGLAATDPETALSRWEKLPPGDAKTTALAGIADALASVDPVAAAQWFGKNLPPLNEKESSGISETGYNRSLGFLSGATPAHLSGTSETLVRLVNAWYEQDPAATVAWAAALPDYGWQVNALFAANGTWKDIRDRAAHAELLVRLPTKRGGQPRNWVLREHLKNWHRADETAARAWIDAHPELPSDMVTQVLSAR